jgi:hypothetical protein
MKRYRAVLTLDFTANTDLEALKLGHEIYQEQDSFITKLVSPHQGNTLSMKVSKIHSDGKKQPLSFSDLNKS